MCKGESRQAKNKKVSKQTGYNHSKNHPLGSSPLRNHKSNGESRSSKVVLCEIPVVGMIYHKATSIPLNPKFNYSFPPNLPTHQYHLQIIHPQKLNNPLINNHTPQNSTSKHSTHTNNTTNTQQTHSTNSMSTRTTACYTCTKYHCCSS